MDDTCATLFSWLDTDGCQDEVSISATSARSDCAVSGVVLRGTQRAPTNAFYVSCSSDRLNDNWNNTSVRLTIVAKVTV